MLQKKFESERDSESAVSPLKVRPGPSFSPLKKDAFDPIYEDSNELCPDGLHQSSQLQPAPEPVKERFIPYLKERNKNQRSEIESIKNLVTKEGQIPKMKQITEAGRQKYRSQAKKEIAPKSLRGMGIVHDEIINAAEMENKESQHLFESYEFTSSSSRPGNLSNIQHHQSTQLQERSILSLNQDSQRDQNRSMMTQVNDLGAEEASS